LKPKFNQMTAGTESSESRKSRRIIITGATGTLGRHVLAECSELPDTQVLALLRSSSQVAIETAGVQYERLDFFDKEAINRALEAFQPTAFIHCAATGMQLPRPSWEEMIRFNVDASVRLCESSARIAGCHFVFVSTGLAYRDQGRPLREEDPLDSQIPYAASKAAADILVRATAASLGIPLTVVRPFSFSGAGDAGSRLFPSLLRAAEERRPLDLSPGDQIRDHCAVQDIAHGIVLAATNRAQSSSHIEVLNLGSGSTISLRKLIEDLVKDLGLEVQLNFGARDYLQSEPKYLVADISRARRFLNWQSRTNFPYAIWQLARESFPSLGLKEPPQAQAHSSGIL
jgi:nucleoside-diphosphate-sugar epimerase